MQAANALKQKRLRDKQKSVPFTVPDLSKVGRIRINEVLCNAHNIKLVCMVCVGLRIINKSFGSNEYCMNV